MRKLLLIWIKWVIHLKTYEHYELQMKKCLWDQLSTTIKSDCSEKDLSVNLFFKLLQEKKEITNSSFKLAGDVTFNGKIQ